MAVDLFSAEATHVTRRFGRFRIFVTKAGVDPSVSGDIIVLVRGEVRDGEGVLCRVASSCVTSTALDSAECDCDEQMQAALGRIQDAGQGVLIYLTDQEGRGHGLTTKVRALRNKNAGLDTFAAVEALSLPADIRDYASVAPILEALDVRSVVLLTNSPEKREAISREVKVEDVEHLAVEPPRWSQPSMRAKRNRGHTVFLDEPVRF
jgi:3,4-dihydroxy 2-butanone 4-phosphate synthase/GTP cyclohydrolase II